MSATLDVLKTLCKQKKLYLTPHLNDVLYCNFQGFAELGGLEEYINLKSLFLEGNVVRDLRSLPPLGHLKSLYLQQNMLESLQGLGSKAPELCVLNVTNNCLECLDGIQECRSLSTLLAARNRFAAATALHYLGALVSLHTLDLAQNELANLAEVLEVLARLPNLRCLYLANNPMVASTKHYRKAVIARLPTLTYLDDRPVDEKERQVAIASIELGRKCGMEQRAEVGDTHSREQSPKVGGTPTLEPSDQSLEAFCQLSPPTVLQECNARASLHV